MQIDEPAIAIRRTADCRDRTLAGVDHHVLESGAVQNLQRPLDRVALADAAEIDRHAVGGELDAIRRRAFARALAEGAWPPVCAVCHTRTSGPTVTSKLPPERRDISIDSFSTS